MISVPGDKYDREVKRARAEGRLRRLDVQRFMNDDNYLREVMFGGDEQREADFVKEIDKALAQDPPKIR